MWAGYLPHIYTHIYLCIQSRPQKIYTHQEKKNLHECLICICILLYLKTSLIKVLLHCVLHDFLTVRVDLVNIIHMNGASASARCNTYASISLPDVCAHYVGRLCTHSAHVATAQSDTSSSDRQEGREEEGRRGRVLFHSRSAAAATLSNRLGAAAEPPLGITAALVPLRAARLLG